MGIVKMKKLLAFIIVTEITALLLYRIYLLIAFLRLSDTHVWNHYPGPCEMVKGVDIGSEDLELLPSGLVLMSTGLQLEPNAVPSRTGKSTILMLDLNQTGKPEATAAEIEWGNDRPGQDFFLHGLSSWKLDEKNVILFAVCHETTGDSVLRFKLNLKTRILYHLETIRDENFFIVNDLAATGERSFYFTNSIYYTSFVMKTVEFLLRLAVGSVGYYNGESSTLKVTGMHVPNGILLSSNQRNVYVAETGEHRLIEFSRDADNSLTKVKDVDIHTFPDNLYLDHHTGQLLVGCHPIPWMIFSLMLHPDTGTPAPSQVIAVQTEAGHITDNMTELLSSMGSDIAGSSTAVIYKNSFLVGTVTHKALICQMGYT